MPGRRVERRRAEQARRERIVGVLVLILGLLVAGVAVFALVRKQGGSTTAAVTTYVTSPVASPSGSASATSSSSTSRSASSASSSTASLSVIVLNNTSIQGLAAQAAGELSGQGWQVTSTSDYQNDIISTCVYYDPDIAGAQAAANTLRSQFSWIARVEPRFAQLPSGPLVLVLDGPIS